LLDSITETYSAALKEAGRSSFHGSCNLATAYQLKVMGIYKDGLDCSESGDKWYDYFQNVSTTSGGYTVTTIGGADCLTELIKTYGNEIYNVVYSLGTGGTSGCVHVLYIRAIIDGYVYFADSFGCTYGSTYYPEGKGTVLTVEKFISSYRSMNGNPYGLVYFTQGDPSEAAVSVSAGSSSSADLTEGEYVINASVLNVRSGGSTDDNVIGSLICGTIVTVYEINGNWGLIDYKGNDGWICLDYADYIEPSSDEDAETAVSGLLSAQIEDESGAVIGDVDGNGKASASDARLVLRIAANLADATEEQLSRADINGDGQVTGSDARMLIRYVAGLQDI
ncbi:MAG: dockerin type I domain-containing protein, partial [Clostridiales bacterium]|nr:dockerin type I domain-containing protein [Clostridiales bacterium]